MFSVQITVVSKELKILVVNMLPSHTCDYIRFITQLHVNVGLLSFVDSSAGSGLRRI